LALLNFQVNRLEDTNSEGTSLSGSGLSLSNSVLSLNHGKDSFFLDGSWFFVTVSVDTTENFFLETHVIKFVDLQIPVSFECFFFFSFLCVLFKAAKISHGSFFRRLLFIVCLFNHFFAKAGRIL